MNTKNSQGSGRGPRRTGMALLLALAAGFGPAATVSAAPIIMSPDPVYDFGEMDSDQKVAHAFVVKNAGDEPLEISEVKTTCGCTVAELETKTLAPGAETKVNVTLNLKGKQGDQVKKITVFSNDPVAASYFLELRGKAIATITMEPNIINLGRIEDNEPHSQSVTLRSTKEGHSFKIEEVKVDEKVPFKTELETVTPGKEYKLAVVTNPNLMAGTLSGRITLMTDDPDHRAMTLNVYGHVIGPLQVMPDSVRIQGNKSPEARPASQNLQVLPGRVKEFELLDIVAPVDGMHAELIQRKANDYIIKLTAMPVDDSLDGKELIVKTNIPEAPEIRIPFQVRQDPAARLGRIPTRIPTGRFQPVTPSRPPLPPAAQ